MARPLALLLFLPTLALAQAAGSLTIVSNQALTQAAPTLATDGFPLSQAKGIRVTLCAASGQTLSGAGTLQAYYNPITTVWARNSALDLSVPAGASGKRCWTFPDMPVAVRGGRAFWAATSVTVSSGTLTLYFQVGL